MTLIISIPTNKGNTWDFGAKNGLYLKKHGWELRGF